MMENVRTINYCPYTIFQKLPFRKSHFPERSQENYGPDIPMHSEHPKKCRIDFIKYFLKDGVVVS